VAGAAAAAPPTPQPLYGESVGTAAAAGAGAGRGDVPSLSELAAAVPRECFEPDVGRSLLHFAIDFGLLVACFAALGPLAVRQPLVFAPVHAVCTGFVMWMVFVVGHDCGHGSFSRSRLLNNVVGHVCHSSLLVPFWPWAYSHRQHHRFHNHRTRDKSHPWHTAEEYNAVSPLVRFLALDHFWGVFLAWPGYLLLESKAHGTDGSHFWPGSRLFDGAPKGERRRCVFSTACCIGALALSLGLCGWNPAAWALGYLLPYGVFSFW